MTDWATVAPGRGEPSFDNEGLSEETTPPANAGESQAASSRPSASTRLVELALGRYRLGVTEDGSAFASPLEGAGHIARMLRADKRGSLRSALAADFYDLEGRAPAQQALTDAINVLDGMAQRLKPEELHMRVARDGASIWIDAGDANGTTLELNPHGWRYVYPDQPIPVRFRRTELTASISMPIREGANVDRLWEFVNVAKEDRSTLLAALVASLIPDMPHPIITLAGEQGTGKSTAARLLAQLIDPTGAPLRKPPRDADGFVTALSGSWVAALDNLSHMPDWLSDSLCRAVTGEGDVRRALFTDSSLSVFAFRRVIILTGIDFAGLRGDLTERMLLVNLHRIPATDRRDDRAIARDWEQASPQIFAGLLNMASAALANEPHVKLPNPPRMADFARIIGALDAANGTSGLTRYAEQGAQIAADTLTSDPFVQRLLELPALDFEGPAGELLARATPSALEWKQPRGWPKDGRHVTTVLKRNAPALRHNRWTVEDLGDNRTGTKVWRVVSPDLDVTASRLI